MNADSSPAPARQSRPRLMGPSFWALIVFGVLCLSAGAGVAVFGPTLFPAPPKIGPPRLVEAGLAPPPAHAPLPAQGLARETETVVDASAGVSEVDRLKIKLENLQSSQAQSTRSASLALAAAGLLEAAQTSRPFVEPWARLSALAPSNPEVRALQALAVSGAPSRATLALDFPEHAARAAVAARTPGTEAGLWIRLQAGLGRVIMVRQVDNVSGKGTDAILARAQQQLAEGDLKVALKTLEALPPPAQRGLGPWLRGARARAELDRRVEVLQVQAAADLARVSEGGL